MRHVLLALLLCTVVAGQAAADPQQRRGGSLGPVGGPRGGGDRATGQLFQEKQRKAEQAKIQHQVAEQKNALARKERQEAFDAAVTEQTGQIDTIRAKAATESRPLSPQEETRIAAISQRIENMRETRAANLAKAQEETAERVENAQERQARLRTLEEDQRRIKGVMKPVEMKPK